jgi:hypothetical protein
MRYVVSFVAAVTALLIIGCSTRSTTSTEKMPEEVRALLDTYGMTEQKIVENADGVQTECILPPVPDPEYGVYAVTFIWGRLLAARVAPPEATDWSGCLGVSGVEGVVKAIFPIDFEDNEDYLDDVDSSSCACWVSKTSGDFDGLGFLVRVREVSALTDCVPYLYFKTVPFFIELPIPKLNCYAAYFPVNDSEGVAILARRVGGIACPRGFMKGEWEPAAGGDDGIFRGMWYDLFGVPVGSMSGSFETVDGIGLFKGCLSGVYLTVVLAELEGTWSYDDPRVCVTCGQGHGWFEGKFRYLNCKRTGVMLGEFGDFSSVSETALEKRALPLKGIWRVNCPSFEDCPCTEAGHVDDPCPGAAED